MNSTADVPQESPPPLVARWLGRMRFAEALELQLRLRDEVAEGRSPPTLLLVEHPPVLTIGRRGSRSDVLWTDAQLEERGVEILETPRGGQVTLHAPGQLVAYPIVPIGRRIRGHLEDLGAVTVRLLEEFGAVGPQFRMDHPGVWTTTPLGDAKLGSIGVHISRGVTVQGLSLNLSVDPTLFGALVSCGVEGIMMISARDLGVTVPSVEDAARRWAELWAAQTKCALRWDAAAEVAAASVH